MAIDEKFIKNLLRRKRWTGADVGKALLINQMYDFTQGTKIHDPLIPQDKFNNLVNGLKTDKDKTDYNFYVNICSYLVEASDKSRSFHYQFSSGYFRYQMFLKDCAKAEELKQKALNYPVIMTQAQYKNIFGKILEEDRNVKKSFFDILFENMWIWIDDNPLFPAPKGFNESLDKIEDQPVKNQMLIDACNDEIHTEFSCGDVCFDGRDLERIQKIKSDLYDEFIKAQPVSLINYPGRDEEESKILFFFEIQLNSAKETLYKLGENISEDDELDLFFKMHSSKKALHNKDISKEDLISLIKNQLFEEAYTEKNVKDNPHSINKGEAYLTAINLINHDCSKENQLKIFIEEYPETYEIASLYIADMIKADHVPTGSEALEENYTVGYLADLGLKYYEDSLETHPMEIALGFKHISEEDSDKDMDSYQLRSRIAKKGVAVLDPNSSEYYTNTTHKINYEEMHDSIDEIGSIEFLYSMNQFKELIPTLRTSNMIPAIKSLLAHNKVIEILEREFDIDLAEAKYDIQNIKNGLDAINSMIFDYYSKIYGDNLKKKQRMFRDLFQPVYMEDCELDSTTIQAVEDLIVTTKETNTPRSFKQNLIIALTVLSQAERRD